MFKSSILGWKQTGNFARVRVIGKIPNIVHVCSYTIDSTGFSAHMHKEMGSDSTEYLDGGQAKDGQFKLAVYDAFMTWVGYKTYTGQDWMYFRMDDELEITYNPSNKRWTFFHRKVKEGKTDTRIYQD